MNKNYDIMIGIEIHIQLKTNSKMFSYSKNNFNDSPNLNISKIDLAYPGTKPLLNKKAFEYAIRLAKDLNMNIPKITSFDRKHYFYHDLPKGFQITQFYYPIGKNGFLKLNNGSTISISQIHLEEDTAKQIRGNNNEIKLDYNRAGIPLIEIVTDYKTINSIKDAMLFVKTLRALLIHRDISDAKMNEGSLRCDLNISIRKKNDSKIGNKVEIKNINSISNLKIALEKEVDYQIKIIESNQKVIEVTKRFDDKKKDVIMIRDKQSVIDYLYFRETNIPTIGIEKENIDKIIKDDNNFFKYIKDLGEQLNVNEEKVLDLIINPYYYVFKQLNKKIKNKLLLLNLFELTIINVLQKSKNFDLDIDKTVKLINLRDKKEISQLQFLENFRKLTVNNSYNVDKEMLLLKKNKLDINKVEKILDNLILKNKDIASQINERPERVRKFFMGQLMKQTKGNINPEEAMKLINSKLK